MTILEKFKLDGKVALVTGASGGLGQAISIALAEAGADVAVHSHHDGGANETCSLIEKTGRKSFAVSGEMSDKSVPQKLIDETVKEFGRIDILINNAGVAGFGNPFPWGTGRR